MVFLDLSRELLEDLSGQFHAVVVVLRELDELHEIALCLVALEVSHLAVIIVELVHCAPILAIADSDNDDTQR